MRAERDLSLICPQPAQSDSAASPTAARSTVVVPIAAGPDIYWRHLSIHELADTLLEHARRGDRGQLELHGLSPAVTVLISRTLDAEGAVAAAEDALLRRQDSLRACRQALRIGLSSMLRQQ